MPSNRRSEDAKDAAVDTAANAEAVGYPVDEPVTTLGSDGSEDGAESPEEHESGLAPESSTGKGKAKETQGGHEHPWQAVWSAEKNGKSPATWRLTYSLVTWTNPLETTLSDAAPPLPAGPTPSQAPAPTPRQFGVVPEIDPALAFLLPPEARGGPSDPTAQSAMFNARTGRFTANDYMYNVEHLSEYNRQRRMTNQYFDQDAWERDMAEHNAKKKREQEAGFAPKPYSKKDMERFRQKKQEKRLRGQAWLRD